MSDQPLRFPAVRICAECQHFRSDGPIWYSQFCAASEREKAIDFVTGKEGYATANDLGRPYVTDQRLDFCRDINTGGNCAKWEAADA